MSQYIYDKIARGDYKTKLPYRTDNVPVDEENMTVRQAREHKEAQKARWRADREAHNADEARLVVQFQADLEEENGVKGHPKAEKLFDLAWGYGHSSGLNEVMQHYEELVELLKP